MYKLLPIRFIGQSGVVIARLAGGIQRKSFPDQMVADLGTQTSKSSVEPKHFGCGHCNNAAMPSMGGNQSSGGQSLRGQSLRGQSSTGQSLRVQSLRGQREIEVC